MSVSVVAWVGLYYASATTHSRFKSTALVVRRRQHLVLIFVDFPFVQI